MKTNNQFSRTICISTNNRCNLSCVYCYENKSQVFTFDVDDAFMMIKDILSSETPHGTKIKLHGGEPFLVFSKIKLLCERIWKEKYNENYSIHITTNGTLVHGEIQDWLYLHRDKVILKLSLDGDIYSHNINRSGSFEQIDIPFFVKCWPDLAVNMTVTPSTLPYFANNVKFMHSVGINSINTNFALLTDWSSQELRKIYHNQLNQLIKFYLENPNIGPINIFKLDISRILNKDTFYSPCNVGQKSTYDYASRQYYPCHMFFPSVCRRDLTEVFKTDFSKRDGLETSHCKACSFLNICRTCYAENLIVRGSMAKRDMNLCYYQKISFAALFNYEYMKILRMDSPSDKDILKMMVIRDCYEEIENIERQLHE